MTRFPKLFLLSVVGLLLMAGCETIPKDALTLSNESLQQRQLQTRKYETTDEAKILSACAGLLQDMGFNIDNSETKLGVISSSKKRSAVSAGQQVARVLVIILARTDMPTDKDQLMRCSVVTRPTGEKGQYVAVRVTFQRIVWNDRREITVREGLTDPKIYQEFFDKLSKSIFLEAQEL
jgi:hypothetical protein